MRLVLLVGAVFIAAGCVTALALNGSFNLPFDEDPRTTSYTGDSVTLTSSLHSYDATFRVTQRTHPVGTKFDSTPVVCHGGMARVTWYVGNLEPTMPNTGIHLSMLMDGAVVSTLLRGGPTGIYNDDPGSMEAAVWCPRGSHTFEVEIVGYSRGGGWGLPYAGDGHRIQRGFIIQEVWNGSWSG